MALKTQQSRIQQHDGNSPGTFNEIEEVVSIGGPDGTAALIETTHLRSVGKEYLAGLADFGQLSLDCNFTGGTQQMLARTRFATQDSEHPYKLEIPNDTAQTQIHTFTFDAIISSWSLNLGTDDKVTLSIVLQISGGVNYALV